MKQIPVIIFLSATGFLGLTGCGNKTSSPNDPAGTGNEKTTENSAQKENTGEITYKTYCNNRFGFCIDYPSDKLYPQGESGSGDGQIFTSKDAENTLWVYRDFRDNEDPDANFNLESAFNTDSQGNNPENPKRVITYKKLGKTFYVVSGYDSGKIFYQKTILTEQGLATALFEYSEKEKDVYDKVSEKIFKSFK